MSEVTVYIVLTVLCVAGSAFFSASEMSYSSCNRIRIENAAEEGDEKARKALRITEEYDNALSAILVGNNLVNIAASSLSSLAVLLTLGESYTWVATAAVTAAVIIFGETIPKIAAKKNATRFALSFSSLTSFLMVILRPVTFIVVGLVDLITKGLKGEQIIDDDAAVEELHSIIETAEDENVIAFRAGVRMGREGSHVDNWAKGGVFVGIDMDTGKLLKTGFIKPPYGTTVTQHPDNGLVFEGFEIPFFNEAVKMAKALHSKLYRIHSVGWDIAITPDGPVFIEGNSLSLIK